MSTCRLFHPISRSLAMVAAWATCLMPLLVLGDCCCASGTVVETSTTAELAQQDVRGEALQASCCAAPHGSRLLASDRSLERGKADSVADVSASSVGQCDCQLECCEPQVLVLTTSDSGIQRLGKTGLPPLAWHDGYNIYDDFHRVAFADTGNLKTRATDPLSFCALLCRWRH